MASNKMATIYCDGKTYDNKDFIKSFERGGNHIFNWNAQLKRWEGEVFDHEIDDISDAFAEWCPEVTVKCVV